jgi:diguanylate cyclase (GGDEF)-like protein
MRRARKTRHPEAEWRAERERDLLERHAPGFLLSLAIFESVMAVINFFVLTGSARIIMPALQLVVAALAALGWWLTRRETVSPELLQWGIGVGLVGLGLLLPLEQWLTGNALLAANLAIMIVALGAILLNHLVFAVTTSILIIAWLAAVLSRDSWNPTAAQQATLIGVALFGGVLIHLNRTNDRTALTRRVQATLESGLRDELTGLWNRRGGRDICAVLVAGAVRERTTVWCMFLDVRGLKGVNDRLGHGTGDILLKGIADVLVDAVAADVIASRWGGDEFCLFGTGPPPDAEALAVSIRATVERVIGVIDQPWDISPGVSMMRAEPGDDAFWRLVDQADEDMYRRRSAGGSLGRSR